MRQKLLKLLINLVGGVLLAGWAFVAFSMLSSSNSPRADLTATYDKVSKMADSGRSEQ
jgi:hypothetical protein